MKRLWKYIKRYRKRYLIATALLILSIILDMFNPIVTKSIIDDVIKGGKYEIFNRLIVILTVIVIGRTVLGYFRELMFDDIGSRVTFDLRKDLFEHIQTLSYSYFDSMNTGKIMSRIKEDADNIWKAVSFGIMLVIDQVLYFIIAAAMMFILNWKLAAVSMITMPIIGFLAMQFEKKVGETFGKISDQTAKLNITAQENISGVRLVKAFAREKYEINKFLKQNENYYKLNVEQANIISNYFPKIEFLSNILIIIVVVGGGYLVIGEDITIGTLVAFSSYIYMLITPMRMVGWLADIMAQCDASLKKINKIFDLKPEIKDAKNAISLKECNGEIKFKDVTFSYNNEPVLKNININVKQGDTIAIMGTTGSGKTSLINLLGRYYETQEGIITLDGIDIKKIKLSDLRRHISMVMQDTFLFSDTIKENIKFGKSNITDEEMIEIAKKADVHSFVDKMPDKYNTVIGERGIGLSGGQKQRISIARALVKKSKILILDDATSALDMETENKIQQAIKEQKDVTKFIIAHRISAVKDADEILIIENGEIVERGTHKRLLDIKGKYYKVYREQYAGLI